MKYLIWIIVIVAVVFGVWKLIQTNPDANIPKAEVAYESGEQAEDDGMMAPEVAFTTVDNANVKVAFKGFGPGKVHDGSFSKVKSDLYFVGGALAGGVDVEVASLSTDTDAVTNHLNTKDFFDTAKFPNANFKVTSMQGSTLAGDMTIHGVTKSINFPMKVEGGAYVADFTLSLKDFGIDQKFANEEFELIVNVPVS